MDALYSNLGIEGRQVIELIRSIPSRCTVPYEWRIVAVIREGLGHYVEKIIFRHEKMSRLKKANSCNRRWHKKNMDSEVVKQIERPVPSNTFLCEGMKDRKFTQTGSAYCVAKMRPVFPHGLGSPEKITIFNVDYLDDKSYKGKFFVFSRVNRPERGAPTVNLRNYYLVSDRMDALPEEDINSDHEYM